MSEPKSASCTRLAEVAGISHDSVNRFLLREAYGQKDLFNEAQSSEQYHRAIKQACHIEHFQVRGKVPILNHVFAALCSYVHL